MEDWNVLTENDGRNWKSCVAPGLLFLWLAGPCPIAIRFKSAPKLTLMLMGVDTQLDALRCALKRAD
jgi:hypothetical protein